MDKPSFFHNNFPIQNDLTSPYAQAHGGATDTFGVGVGKDKFVTAIQTDGSDSPYSILAGEDRMSSVADGVVHADRRVTSTTASPATTRRA